LTRGNILFPVNKKILIAIVAILVIAVGGYGIYRVVKHFNRVASTPAVQTQTAANTPTQSLRDLIAQGVSQSCTYSTENSHGMIYLGGGKIRGDFVVPGVQQNGQPTNAHMIIMNNMNYLWTDGIKTGMKVAFDENATPNPQATPNTNFDANAKLNFKCSPWVVDATMFTLPTGISFMTVSAPAAPTSGSPASSSGSSTSACSYCNALSGDKKTQCLTALNCQ